jgi:O-antigen/teichoic acid export membrane protein
LSSIQGLAERPVARSKAPAAASGSRHFVVSVFQFGVFQCASWVGAAALAIMLPRFLGAENLGRLGFAIGLTTLVGLIANLGTATFVVKEVARRPEKAPELTINALAMRVPLTVVAAGIAVAVVTVTSRDPVTHAVVYLLCLGILVDSARGIVQGTLQGLQRMRTLAAFPAVSTSIYALAAAAVLLAGAGVVAVAAAYVAGQAAGLALSAIALRRALPSFPRPHPRVWRLLLLSGLPFFVWQAALVVYGQVDSVLLSFLTNYAVVGWYVAAYKIVTLPIFVPTILMTVVFPALSAASGAPERFNPIARKALLVSLLVTLPMALGIMLEAGHLVRLLGYPESFQNSILPIVLLAPSFPLVAADMIIGTTLNARDRQRQWALTAVAAAVLNPALNLIAIPYTQARYGNGAIGAAAVTTLTEVFMMCVGLWLLPRGVLDRGTVLRCLGCLAAGLVMTAVILPLRSAPLLVVVAVGAATYGAAALALRIVSISEVLAVVRHLLSRGAGTGAEGTPAEETRAEEVE